MSQKRKISIRKVLQVFLGLVATGCCFAGLISASNIESNRTLTNVDVNITNGDKYRFLNNSMIMDIAVNSRHVNVMREPVKTLDIHQMEHILAANPWVANAQVYIDNKRVLHMDVTQRVPVARVFEDNGGSYYLDTSLSQVPVSDQFTYYTTIVTNVPRMHEDSTSMQVKGEIVGLVKFIEQNSFWRAQIAQIAMDTNNTFQLIPVLGSHVIVLGDTSNMQEKFDNLMLFYKKILNHIGWDKYEKLDLRFKGQVVASPSLPWKGPVDKGMKTMSWYASIMDSLRSKNDVGVVTPAVANTVVAVAKTDVKPQTVKAPAKPPPVKNASVLSAKAHVKETLKKVKKLPDKKKESKEEKYIYKGTNTTRSN